MENMQNKDETFRYTYSAKQQDEVKKIRQKYAPQEESKIDQLRKLDKLAEKPGSIASIILGTVSTLVMGVGMCCTMVWTQLFVLGIVIGVIGIAGIALAYPLFQHQTKKQREKLAPQILRLTEELLQ